MPLPALLDELLDCGVLENTLYPVAAPPLPLAPLLRHFWLRQRYQADAKARTFKGNVIQNRVP